MSIQAWCFFGRNFSPGRTFVQILSVRRCDVDMESEQTDKSQFNTTFQGSSEKPELSEPSRFA